MSADGASETAVVAIVADLMFGSRIAGAGAETVRTLDALATRLTASNVRLVLVDLDIEGLDPGEVVAAAGAVDPAPRVVGFVSHVRADRIAEARDAGFDEVFARSAFVQRLGALMAQ